MDSIDMFMAHVNRMYQYAAYAVPARNVEALLNDTNVKKALIQKQGQEGYNQIVDAVRMQLVGRPGIDPATEAIGTWNSVVAASFVAGKASVMLAQPLDTIVAAAYDENGFADLATGLNELGDRSVGEITKEMEAVLEPNSGEYWKRYKSDESATVQTFGMIKRQGYFRPPSIAQQAMRPTTTSEYYTAAIFNYLAAKAAARRAFGLQPDDYSAFINEAAWVEFVAQKWNNKTRRGSTTSQPIELSGSLRFARKNPLAGLVMNFMNTSKNVYSLASLAQSESRSGRYKQSAKYLGSFLASTVLFSALQEALSFEEDEEFVAGTGKRAITNIVGLFPIVGDIANAGVVRPLLGLPEFRDNPVLLQEALVEATKGSTKIALTITGLSEKEFDQEDFNKQLVNTATEVSSLFGQPGPAVKDYSRRVFSGKPLPGLQTEQ